MREIKYISYMYSHTRAHTHTHTHTHTYIYIYIYTCVCARTRLCVCVTNTDTRRSSIEGNIVNKSPGLIMELLFPYLHFYGLY